MYLNMIGVYLMPQGLKLTQICILPLLKLKHLIITIIIKIFISIIIVLQSK